MGFNLGKATGISGLGKKLGLSGPSPSGYRKNQGDAAQGLAGYLPEYQKLAAQGAGQFNLYQPKQTAAANQYLNYLQTDPYAGGRNSAMYKQATAGLDDTFARQQAALTRRSAQTGIPVGAGLNDLAIKRQGMLNQINTQLAAQRDAATEGRMNRLFGVTSGLAQQGQQNWLQGLAGGQGIYGNMYGIYGDMANADEARKAQSQASLLGAIGQLGGLYGNLATGGGLGAFNLFNRKKK